MKKQLFPKEIIENTIEFHNFKHSTKSNIIYNILLISLIGFFVSLPFIKVSVYNTSQGLIRPDKERVVLQTSTTGKIIFHQILNNLQVKKGDTLLLIDNSFVSQQINTNETQLDEVQTFIDDLQLLTKNMKSQDSLVSQKYQQEYRVYLQRKGELEIRFNKIKRDDQRNQQLFDKGVIAKVELENSKLEYDLSLNAIYQYQKQQKSDWENQLVNYQNQLKELENNHVQLNDTQNLSVIKAPVSGTLLNVNGIEEGGFVPMGMQLGELSPFSDLIVECYINPSDIGLLRKNMKVNFQVSAFNYNQWGLATGKIKEIGSDVQMINNAPIFKIVCSLDQEFLQLKNGFKGTLKKGMLVNARFEITQRTLFDLLYDKVDDWLNPASQMAKN